MWRYSFSPRRTLRKSAASPWKTIELKVVRRRDRDVAWIAQDVNQPHIRIVRLKPQFSQLMVRFVAAEIRNPMLSFDRDFFLIRLPEARHRAANQFRDQPCRPGTAALRIADDDDLLHQVSQRPRRRNSVARTRPDMRKHVPPEGRASARPGPETCALHGGGLTCSPEDRRRQRRDDRARPAAGAILRSRCC